MRERHLPLWLLALILVGCVVARPDSPAPVETGIAAAGTGRVVSKPIDSPAAPSVPAEAAPPTAVAPAAAPAPTLAQFTPQAPGTVSLPSRIRFSPGSSSISHLERQKIRRLASALNKDPGSRLELTAGADDFAREALNQQLASDRLKQVVRALEKAGISGRRLDTQPLAVDRKDCDETHCTPDLRSVDIVVRGAEMASGTRR